MHVSWLLRRDTLEAFVHKLSQMRSLSLTEHVIFFSLFLLSLTASLSSQDFPHPFSWNTVAVFSLMKNSSSFLFFISQPLSQTRIIFSLVSFLLPLSSYTYSQKKRLYLCPHLSPLSLPKKQEAETARGPCHMATVTEPANSDRTYRCRKIIVSQKAHLNGTHAANLLAQVRCSACDAPSCTYHEANGPSG